MYSVLYSNGSGHATFTLALLGHGLLHTRVAQRSPARCHTSIRDRSLPYTQTRQPSHQIRREGTFFNPRVFFCRASLLAILEGDSKGRCCTFGGIAMPADVQWDTPQGFAGERHSRGLSLQD
eukprot:c4356_g2_i1 orf=78-443(-)